MEPRPHLSWSQVAARRGVPCILFGTDQRAGTAGCAFNAYWCRMQEAANDPRAFTGPSAA